jgi:hypothetical protein
MQLNKNNSLRVQYCARTLLTKVTVLECSMSPLFGHIFFLISRFRLKSSVYRPNLLLDENGQFPLAYIQVHSFIRPPFGGWKFSSVRKSKPNRSHTGF